MFDRGEPWAEILERVDINTNLLGEIRKKRVLEDEEVKQIEGKKTEDDKQRELIMILNAKSEETKDRFIENVLAVTHPKVYENYFIDLSSTSDEEDEPSLKKNSILWAKTSKLASVKRKIEGKEFETDLRSQFDGFRNAMVAMLDKTPKIVDSLYEKSKLTNMEAKLIKRERNHLRRNEVLLDCIRRCKDDVRGVVLEELQSTNQHQVLFLFVSSEFSLETEHSKIILKNFGSLREHLKVTPELLKLLQKTYVLTYRDMNKIASELDPAKKNEMLLGKLSGKSKEHFEKFLECLSNENLLIKEKLTGSRKSESEFVDFHDWREIRSQCRAAKWVHCFNIFAKYNHLPKILRLQLSTKVMNKLSSGHFDTYDFFRARVFKDLMQNTKSFLKAMELIDETTERLSKLQSVNEFTLVKYEAAENEKAKLKEDNMHLKKIEIAHKKQKAEIAKAKDLVTVKEYHDSDSGCSISEFLPGHATNSSISHSVKPPAPLKSPAFSSSSSSPTKSSTPSSSSTFYIGLPEDPVGTQSVQVETRSKKQKQGKKFYRFSKKYDNSGNSGLVSYKSTAEKIIGKQLTDDSQASEVIMRVNSHEKTKNASERNKQEANEALVSASTLSTHEKRSMDTRTMILASVQRDDGSASNVVDRRATLPKEFTNISNMSEICNRGVEQAQSNANEFRIQTGFDSKVEVRAQLRKSKFYKELHRLRNNKLFIIENIQPVMKELLDRLESMECLTGDRRSLMDRLKNDREKADELLTILRSSDITGYLKFIDCLRVLKLGKLVGVLEKGGVVVRVKVVNKKSSNLEEIEDALVKQLDDIYFFNGPKGVKVTAFLKELKDSDVHILQSTRHDGVALWLWCKSSWGLRYLGSVVQSGSLLSKLTKLFKHVLTTNDKKKQTVEPHHIDVDMEQFEQTTDDPIDQIDKDDVDDILYCGICLKEFVEPKALPCQHTFCLKCLEPLENSELSRKSGKLICPLCRYEFVRPRSGVKGLKDNFMAKRLSVMMRNKEKMNSLTKEDASSKL